MARTTWELELKAKGGARAKALARDLRDLDAVLRSLGESSKVLKSISSDVSALRGARVRIRAEKSVGAETVRQQQRTARAFDENGRVRRAVEKAQARDARVASRAEAADQTERRRIGEGIARASERAAREEAMGAQRRARDTARAAQADATERRRIGEGIARAAARADRDDAKASHQTARRNSQAFARDQAMARQRVKAETRAQREAGQIGRQFRAKRAADEQRWERLVGRQRAQAQREARQAAAQSEARSARRRAVASTVVGGAGLALAGGIGIAGATVGALSSLVSMAGAAATLTAGIGGAVLQMIAFREASLGTLRAMARDSAGRHLVGAAADAQARETFRRAQQFARETPLDEQQVLQLQAQTSAAGFTGARNWEVVQAAGDVGALNPNDEGASSRFLLGLGQLRNASSVRTQDLRQTAQAANLGENDILRAIARESGQTQRQGESDASYNSRIQKMQREGRFTGEQGVQGVLAALRERTNMGAGDYARQQGSTLKGTLSNLQSAVFSFVTGIEDIENLPGIRALKKTLNGFVTTLTGTSATSERLRLTFAALVDDAAQFFGSVGGKNGFESTINDALDVFTEMRPVVSDVTRAFGLSFWAPVSRELRLVFAQFRGGDIREAALHAGQLGQSMGEVLAMGIDITYAMGGLGNVIVRVTGNVLALTDMLIENPEMIRDVWDDLPGAFEDIGRQIPLGMREGLAMERQGMLDDLRAFNADIAASTRADLQIHSPSRLFEYFGAMIPAGMAQGIDGGARDVERAMGGMVAPQGLPGFGPGSFAGLGGGGITIGEVHIHASGSNGGDLASEFIDELERRAAMGGA